jgi:hypothetical protein
VERTAVQTGHQPFNHNPGDQFEVTDPGNQLGVRRSRSDGHDSGTASSSLPTI